MTFFAVASILALALLALRVGRLVSNDGSDTPRRLRRPPRSHPVDLFGDVATHLH